ncbi:rhamnulokinase [Tenggerimyces flavus]|uniref:Rhamnulokinase family protein n=1 Tax=Tenggerimyces flavus TaxID=1708749 RepID=A0ABV7Y847_9ACTN|nr:rhamnulokinase family protein [Tenggerimyces flavus]MBM7785379.1 rhamnulokinase [Tenggerimyces flavus]
MSPFVAAAVDLGASSGRVLRGEIGPDVLAAKVVHRFPNEPVEGPRLTWDLDGLWGGIQEGLQAAGAVQSIGVDSWGVDYGLLDERGALIAPPVHYRDNRTDGVMERVRASLGDAALYEQTGLQFMQFNTIYQLLAEDPELLERARTMLLIPDLIGHKLTGSIGAERTNVSTTQLYDQGTRSWATDLASSLGIPTGILPPLREPGDVLGTWQGARVTAVASHDTASAVVAVPAEGERFAYISCGTWSLVGVELASPVLTAESLAANFTNEVGVDGTIRFLRNVMGLWLLQECMRWWAPPLEWLLEQAAREPGGRFVVDAESEEFLAPGNMPERIQAYCARTGQPVPRTAAEITRCILDSLAVAHARNVRAASRLSGQPVDAVHIVGGGSQNALLCQLTADASGLPVLAGPVEATALGNLLVQARAAGVVESRQQGREFVRRTQELRRYTPRDS